MAFRALLFSANPETSSAMTAACQSNGIRSEVCTDIFSAIEKAKTRAYSCVITDWAAQPEASFLLKRARESTPNKGTVAVAIVDNEPTAAEMRENRLDFLIYRPISTDEANEVLAKATEQMQPLSAADAAEPASQPQADPQAGGLVEEGSSDSSQNASEPLGESTGTETTDGANTEYEETRRHGSANGLPKAFAAALILAAALCIWRSRDSLEYLAKTSEGRGKVFKESIAALFYMSPSGALPVNSAGSDAQQDAYFSRVPGNSNGSTPKLGVAATESTLPDTRIPLPKAADFPLPAPEFEHQDPPPVHVLRAVIPDSMKNSPPIAGPVVVTVSPAQMMPVSAPQVQSMEQQVSEPVSLTEDAARALLVHSVDPVYPEEGLSQKLHGPVVLQALVGRDGSVQDLKIVRGYFILGKAAIAAVKQWHFQPYSLNGHPASMQTVITINFSTPAS
jgi:TonB family protein